MPGTQASPGEPAREAARRLAGIEPRNSTDLHAGWLTGCEQVAAGLQAEGVNRVLLLTDGLANRGVTDPDELARLAYDLRRRGVATSTFGVGHGLRRGAAPGHGRQRWRALLLRRRRDRRCATTSRARWGRPSRSSPARSCWSSRCPESVRVEPLSPFRVEQGGGRARILLGDMVSGQLLSDRRCASRSTSARSAARWGIVVRVADRDGAFERAAPALAPASHRLDLRGPRRQRRPAARRRGGPGRRPAVRRACEAGRRAAQPRGPLRRRPPDPRRRARARRGLRGLGRRAAGARGRALGGAACTSRRRCPRWPARRRTSQSSNVSRMRTADGKSRRS